MTQNEAQELKPCPFCGGKPYLANVAMVGCAYVVCTDCRMQSDDGGKDRVVAAWNRRADLAPTPQDARVTALRDAAENLLDAINAEDRFGDRSLTITGPTENLQWLIDAEEEASAALAAFDTTGGKADE